jgi:hypothetical protein
MDWSEFWWSHITGSNMVVSNVVESLLAKSTVVLEVPEDLPWRQEMRRVIERDFRDKSHLMEHIVEIIDAADECQGEAPGAFLLEHYSPSREIRLGYRARSKKTIQDYIKENGVLKNRVIWVKGLTGAQATAWMNFCREYNHGSLEDGLFVLEVHGNVVKQPSKWLNHIRYLDTVTNYDVQLFNSFVLDTDVSLTPNWKRYIATAVAVLCDTDAEIAELMLQPEDLKTVSFIHLVQELADDPYYAKRGANASSGHLFSFFRSGDLQEIERRLWKAQVQVLFPLIEIERISIVEKYIDILQDALDNNYVEQYRKQLTSPVEIEFGTLCYMIASGVVYISDRFDRDRIHFLHDIRNELAHAHFCDTSKVKELLDGQA